MWVVIVGGLICRQLCDGWGWRLAILHTHCGQNCSGCSHFTSVRLCYWKRPTQKETSLKRRPVAKFLDLDWLLPGSTLDTSETATIHFKILYGVWFWWCSIWGFWLCSGSWWWCSVWFWVLLLLFIFSFPNQNRRAIGKENCCLDFFNLSLSFPYYLK